MKIDARDPVPLRLFELRHDPVGPPTANRGGGLIEQRTIAAVVGNSFAFGPKEAPTPVEQDDPFGVPK